MPRIPSIGALAIALAVLTACGDQPRPLPTTPPGAPRLLLTGAPACQPGDAAYITSPTVIASLFAPSVAAQAQTRAGQVQATCPSTVATLDYVAAILAWRQTGAVIGSDANLWTYLTRLFAFDGYALPNTAASLGPQGFVGLCDPAGCALVAPAKTSGVKINPGALATRVLVTGEPASCTPALQGTSLQLFPQCLRIEAAPIATQSLELGPAGAIVQLCMVEGSPSFLYTPSATTGIKPGRIWRQAPRTGRVEIRPPAQPFFAADCDPAIVASAARARGRLESLLDGHPLLARLAHAATDAFTPRSLYAGHGGLGTLPGSSTLLSLFGPLDPFLFQATFSADVIGQPPAVPDRGRGSWTVVPTAYGSVTVQPSFADIPSKVAVLRQSAPIPFTASPIQLVAQMASQPGQVPFPTFGTYRIRWRSVVGSSRVFDAPLLVLDSRGRVLARFDYRVGPQSGSGSIRFDGQDVATWTQNVSQLFQITVDLTNRTASFGIVGPTGVLTPLVQDAPFPDATVSPGTPFDLARLAWQLRGMGAQVIGIDDIEVVGVPAGND